MFQEMYNFLDWFCVKNVRKNGKMHHDDWLECKKATTKVKCKEQRSNESRREGRKGKRQRIQAEEETPELY